MYQGNAKRQRFADGRFSYYIAICYIKNQWILK